MQVINATVPTAPVVVPTANFLLPTSTSPYVLGNIGSNTGEAVGNSAYYYNGYLYLGLTQTSNGPAFHIIDVHDPLNPVWVGSWPAPSAGFGPSGGSINSIVVKGKYAYVGHANGLVGATSEQLTVLDVSVPSNPVRVSGYSDALGPAVASGKSLGIIGNKLFFGRSASNDTAADSIPEFYILNASDPTSIPGTPLGSTPLAITEGINTLRGRSFLCCARFE
jgi:hypothetical protein